MNKTFHIVTDEKYLMTGYGYISNKEVKYNPNADVCVIIKEKISSVGTGLNQFFEKKYIDYCHKWFYEYKDLQRFYIYIQPFTQRDFKELYNISSLDQVTPEQQENALISIAENEFKVPNNGTYANCDLVFKYTYVSGEQINPVVIDFAATQKSLGYSDEEFVTLILNAVSDKVTPKKISKQKNGKIDYPYSKDEFQASAFMKLYSSIVLKCNVGSAKVMYGTVKDGLKALFNNLYFHGDTNVFQNFVFQIKICICRAIEKLVLDNAIFTPYTNATVFIGTDNTHDEYLYDHELDKQINIVRDKIHDSPRKSRVLRLFRGFRCSTNISCIEDIPEKLGVEYTKANSKYNPSLGYEESTVESPATAIKFIIKTLESTDSWRNNPNYKPFNLAILSKLNEKRIAEGDKTRTHISLARYVDQISTELLNELRVFSGSMSNAQTMRYLNHLIDFILEFNSKYKNKIISLRDLTPAHFYHPLSKNTDYNFYKYLESISDELKTKSNIWSQVKTILQKIIRHKAVDGWGISNPMPDAKGIFKKLKVKNSVTVRAPMPSDFYSLCLESLTENDYKIVKNNFPSQTVTLYNHQTQINEQVFMPNLAHILHLMMILPLRGHQARWLDEGLLDEEIWNYDTHTYEMNMTPFKNYRYSDGERHCDKYGATSVIQSKYQSGIDGISLYINTNKTKSYTLQKKGHTGYSIPWVINSGIENVDEVFNILKRQKEFNNKYSPKYFKPVKTVDEDAGKYSQDIFEQLPAFTPIFRDISSPKISQVNPSMGTIYLPPTHALLRTLFIKVLEKAEEKYKAKNKNYKNIHIAFDGEHNPLYDLHGLRVFGITDLLTQGLDKEIVKLLVGHNTSIMTMYYYKLGEAAYRKLLLKAKKKAGLSVAIEKQIFEDGFDNLDYIDNANLVDEFEGYEPDMSQGGIPRFSKGGICLSFDCSTGGVKITYSATGATQSITLVNGGVMRCGNCRYWRSGPRFIAEQIFYMNQCASEIQDLVLERIDIYSQINESYDKYHEPEFVIKRLTEKSDRITEKLVSRVTELQHRQKMFDESLKKVNISNVKFPTLFGDENDFSFSEESLNLLDTNMEMVIQALMLGLDASESKVNTTKLDKFVNKIYNEAHVRNPLLYMPDDNVKQAAILYVLFQTKEMLGEPITDEQFEDPRLLFNDYQKASLLLKALKKIDSNATGELISE